MSWWKLDTESWLNTELKNNSIRQVRYSEKIYIFTKYGYILLNFRRIGPSFPELTCLICYES